jgi:hypothetical protein
MQFSLPVPSGGICLLPDAPVIKYRLATLALVTALLGILLLQGYDAGTAVLVTLAAFERTVVLCRRLIPSPNGAPV